MPDARVAFPHFRCSSRDSRPSIFSFHILGSSRLLPTRRTPRATRNGLRRSIAAHSLPVTKKLRLLWDTRTTGTPFTHAVPHTHAFFAPARIGGGFEAASSSLHTNQLGLTELRGKKDNLYLTTLAGHPSLPPTYCAPLPPVSRQCPPIVPRPPPCFHLSPLQVQGYGDLLPHKQAVLQRPLDASVAPFFGSRGLQSLALMP